MADCHPIILYSSKNHAFALLHAGRVGLEKNIIKNAAKMLSANDLIAFVGAGIRECCYEISGDLLAKYKCEKSEFLCEKNARFYLNMTKMIEAQFSEIGVKKFEILNKCTKCSDEFYSYRRNKACGRFGLICALK